VQVVAGRTYFYRLERVLPGGGERQYGPLRAQALAPERFALTGVSPNPFNPSTTVTFEVARPEPMRPLVYNALGQKVRTLVDAATRTGHPSRRVERTGRSRAGGSIGRVPRDDESAGL